MHRGKGTETGEIWWCKYALMCGSEREADQQHTQRNYHSRDKGAR